MLSFEFWSMHCRLCRPVSPLQDSLVRLQGIFIFAKTRLVKTVCASLKAAGRAGGEPAHVLAARVWGLRLGLH